MSDVVSLSELSEPIAEKALEQIFFAQTAYKFSDQPVSDETLQRVWELARWAPTSANLQPLRVTFVSSPEGKARLVEHMNDNNKARVEGAPVTAIVGWDKTYFEHMPVTTPHMASFGETLAGNDGLARTMGTFSSALQIGYLILAARAEGLAVGPMGGFNKAALDADFYPDGDWESQLVINLGYATEGSFRDRLPRLDTEEVLRFA